MTKEIILDRLWALEDSPYRDFTANLIPTVEKSCIIGVRTPAMRVLAKELVKHYPTEAMSFLEELPHYYYEENNLHGFIIEQLKDFDKAMQYTDIKTHQTMDYKQRNLYSTLRNWGVIV